MNKESFRSFQDAQGRRLGAVTALVLGLFVGLTLLPIPVTGPVGHALGHALWQMLGAGALGIPLLGVGLALAGFDRLGALDMKRSAALIIGLRLLLPYLVGVLAQVGRTDLDIGVAERGVAARIVGVLPGFFAETISNKVGVAGAVLLGFLGLSALTLATFAWHPLQRLERSGRAGQRDSGTGNTGLERPAGTRGAGKKKTLREDSLDPESTESSPSLPSPVIRVFTEARSRKGRKRGGSNDDGGVAVIDEESDLPPIDKLNIGKNQDVDAGEEELDRLGRSLIETLRTFKVEGKVNGRTTGPVVTQFEVVPAPGVKAGRIVSLSDDLAISMRVPSVRVAPIPGKGAVGVEVPNPIARIVTVGELINSTEDWISLRAALPIALGRDLEGKPVVADLAKMPHLLIAGATGTGKSVTINTIITSLVYRYTPKELRLLMIDPKMVELSMYNALPHLRHKVVTNNHDAASVLKWAVMEMQRRYELLQANGARNIADFNRKVEEGKPLKNPPRPKPTLTSVSEEPPNTPPEPPADDSYTDGVLPFIVMIIALRAWGGHVSRFLPARVAELWDRFHEGSTGALTGRSIPVILVLTTFIWLLEGARLYFVILALALPEVGLGISSSVFVALAAALLTAIPLTPAGFGFVEAGIIGVLYLYGVPQEPAAAVALVDRGLTVVTVILLGGILYAVSQKVRRAHGTRPAPSTG